MPSDEQKKKKVTSNRQGIGWVIQTFETSTVDLFCEFRALSAVWVLLPIHSDEDAFVDSGNGFWSGERCNSSRGGIVDFLWADTIRESWRWSKRWPGLTEGGNEDGEHKELMPKNSGFFRKKLNVRDWYQALVPYQGGQRLPFFRGTWKEGRWKER